MLLKVPKTWTLNKAVKQMEELSKEYKDVSLQGMKGGNYIVFRNKKRR